MSWPYQFEMLPRSLIMYPCEQHFIAKFYEAVRLSEHILGCLVNDTIHHVKSGNKLKICNTASLHYKENAVIKQPCFLWSSANVIERMTMSICWYSYVCQLQHCIVNSTDFVAEKSPFWWSLSLSTTLGKIFYCNGVVTFWKPAISICFLMFYNAPGHKENLRQSTRCKICWH